MHVAYDYACQVDLQMCFICACMDVITQQELCFHEHIQLVADAACMEWVATNFLAR